MSMSMPGEIRRPSAKPAQTATAADDDGKKIGPTTSDGESGAGTASAKTESSAKTQKKPAGTKSAGTKVGGGPGGKGRTGAGKGPRRPVSPVKISQGHNWNAIALFSAAALLAIGIVGWATVALWRESHKPSWEDRANAIQGIVDYRKQNPGLVNKKAGHKWGVLSYPQNPPVGGVHNYLWQNCAGNVYTEQIPKEQAVHSLEHGAVWVTYRPDLPADQVAKLASRVEGVDHTLMSPYPGLDAPISLQAWGFQLKLDNASDSRIDEFIRDLRGNAAVENASCDGGITDPGTVPMDLGKPTTPPAATPSAAASAAPSHTP